MLHNAAPGLGYGRPRGRTLALLATTFLALASMLALSASARAANFEVTAKENPEQQAGSPVPSPEGWVVRMLNTEVHASTVIGVSSEAIALEGASGEAPHASGIAPAGCALAGSSIACNLNLPQEPFGNLKYVEVCYNGSPPGKMTFSGSETTEGVSTPIVNAEVSWKFGEGLPPACGVPGWTPAAASAGSGSSTAGSGTSTGATGSPSKPKPWSHAFCRTTYKKWAAKHKHATRRQKKTEANGLHKSHGCPLSLLK